MLCAQLPLKNMESCSPCSSAAPKTERKILERNRRNHIKNLYNQLYSLLPKSTSKEALSLPDQLYEAVNYIKSLQTRVEKSKEKKERLMRSKKRSHTCTTTTELAPTSSKSPFIEILEINPAQHMVLINELQNQFRFYEIIRRIHQEGYEIVNATFSAAGNSILHLLHPKIGRSMSSFGAAGTSERLKMLIDGSTSGTGGGQSELAPWDFDIQPDPWELDIPEVMKMGF